MTYRVRAKNNCTPTLTVKTIAVGLTVLAASHSIMLAHGGRTEIVFFKNIALVMNGLVIKSFNRFRIKFLLHTTRVLPAN